MNEAERLAETIEREFARLEHELERLGPSGLRAVLECLQGTGLVLAAATLVLQCRMPWHEAARVLAEAVAHGHGGTGWPELQAAVERTGRRHKSLPRIELRSGVGKVEAPQGSVAASSRDLVWGWLVVLQAIRVTQAFIKLASTN